MTDKTTKPEPKPLPVLPGLEPIAKCGVCSAELFAHSTYKNSCEGRYIRCPLHALGKVEFDEPAEPDAEARPGRDELVTHLVKDIQERVNVGDEGGDAETAAALQALSDYTGVPLEEPFTDPSLLIAVHDLRQQRAALRDALIPFLHAYAHISDEKAGLSPNEHALYRYGKGILELRHIWNARRVMKETEVKP